MAESGVEPQADRAAAAELSGEAVELRAAFSVAGGESDAVEAFYSARDYEPFWLADGAADALLDVLDAADAHGLPVARYDIDALEEARARGDAQAEIALMSAFLRYARDVRSGVLEPRRVDREIDIRPPRPARADLLADLSATASVDAYLASLPPQPERYQRLLAEKVRLEALLTEGGWGDPVPAGDTLRPGDRSPRIEAVRARLLSFGVEEGVRPADGAPADRFDDDLVAAVKMFQTHHGLNDDGVIGRRTAEALNSSVADRLRQVIVNLERNRWLNKPLGERHIFVNLADYMMTLVDNGEPTLTSRVVIGERRHRTIEFSDEMEHMVVNPTWNVPRSIATEEILPALQADPSYLTDRDMQLIPTGSEPAPGVPELKDWSGYSVSNFPFRIRQRPGRGNALGRVKFMFPNEYAIYLHDTPSRSLFARDARAFSHGCIRVQKPVELAEALLARQSGTPAADFQRYLEAEDERYVHLDVHVPVHLTYQTAWVGRDGIPQYRDDIYGRDRRVFAALQALGVSLPDIDT
ncbi:MAG: L,D-transpeptidase family protein [Pseudomonadota bacterium]